MPPRLASPNQVLPVSCPKAASACSCAFVNFARVIESNSPPISRYRSIIARSCETPPGVTTGLLITSRLIGQQHISITFWTNSDRVFVFGAVSAPSPATPPPRRLSDYRCQRHALCPSVAAESAVRDSSMWLRLIICYTGYLLRSSWSSATMRRRIIKKKCIDATVLYPITRPFQYLDFSLR
jgi:hypothetical protein